MGKFSKGKSGNPGGRPATPESVKDILRNNTEAAALKLISLLEDQDPRIVLRAAEIILDRALGKPAQSLEIEARAAAADRPKRVTLADVYRELQGLPPKENGESVTN